MKKLVTMEVKKIFDYLKIVLKETVAKEIQEANKMWKKAVSEKDEDLEYLNKNYKRREKKGMKTLLNGREGKMRWK